MCVDICTVLRFYHYFVYFLLLLLLIRLVCYATKNHYDLPVTFFFSTDFCEMPLVIRLTSVKCFGLFDYSDAGEGHRHHHYETVVCHLGPTLWVIRLTSVKCFGLFD